MSSHKRTLLLGRQMLSELEKLYKREGRLQTPIDAIDVLDDLAFLGVPGSSTIYIRHFKTRRRSS